LSARQVFFPTSWGTFATIADIVAAIEQATIDGVDVINVSAGADEDHDTLSTPLQLAVMNAGQIWCGWWCVHANV